MMIRPSSLIEPPGLTSYSCSMVPSVRTLSDIDPGTHGFVAPDGEHSSQSPKVPLWAACVQCLYTLDLRRVDVPSRP